MQIDEPGDYEAVFYVKIGINRYEYKTYETGGILHVAIQRLI